MKTQILPVVATYALLFFPNITFAQAPNLGTAAGFVLFSTTGAIGNTGISHITGNVMKVAIAKIKGASSIVVYPNPVTNNMISMRLNNIGKGIYILKLFNWARQLTAIKTIHHSGTSSLEFFEIKEKLAAGRYDLKLAGEGIVLTTPLIKR